MQAALLARTKDESLRLYVSTSMILSRKEVRLMSKTKLHSLDPVVEAMAQLIAVTKQWLLSQETRSMQQLVLNAERIKALDNLEKLIRKELKSAKCNSERIWQLVNVVIATVTHYALDRLNDSIRYKLRHEKLRFMFLILRHTFYRIIS